VSRRSALQRVVRLEVTSCRPGALEAGSHLHRDARAVGQYRQAQRPFDFAQGSASRCSVSAITAASLTPAKRLKISQPGCPIWTNLRGFPNTKCPSEGSSFTGCLSQVARSIASFASRSASALFSRRMWVMAKC